MRKGIPEGFSVVVLGECTVSWNAEVGKWEFTAKERINGEMVTVEHAFIEEECADLADAPFPKSVS